MHQQLQKTLELLRRSTAVAQDSTTMEAPEVRMVAALVRPDDHGMEAVTLANLGTSPLLLNGWRLLDRLGRVEALDGLVVPASSCLGITLSGLGARLGTQGGSIRLVDRAGEVVHRVDYTPEMMMKGGVVRLA